MTKALLLRHFVYLLFFIPQVVFSSSLIVIKEAWIPEPPPVASVLAAYLQIRNTSAKAIDIIKIESGHFTRIEIHRTIEKDGMMQMDHLEKLTIPAHSNIELSPGGLHLMLFNPKQTLRSGDKVVLEFVFSDSQRMTIHAKVRHHSWIKSQHPHDH